MDSAGSWEGGRALYQRVREGTLASKGVHSLIPLNAHVSRGLLNPNVMQLHRLIDFEKGLLGGGRSITTHALDNRHAVNA